MTERAAIVKWLRDSAAEDSAEGSQRDADYLNGHADAIERGQHLLDPDPGRFACSCKERIDGSTRWDPKCKNHGVE